MACEICGEKPKKCGNCNKDFPRAVIEINNPETLVLFRRVVIPASLGDVTTIPPTPGKYHNVLLKYEASHQVYLYSSDGIPTLLETDVPPEVWGKLDELQWEIDDLKNSPDVVDIVGTYAELESYDTSDLGDKDVIRVLVDETHDGESSYYRWSTTTQTWNFIGATGPYYTKDEVNSLLEGKQGVLTFDDTPIADSSNPVKSNGVKEYSDSLIGKARLLTADDYNWNSVDKSATGTLDSVALWRCGTGLYTVDTSLDSKTYLNKDNGYNNSSRFLFLVVNPNIEGMSPVDETTIFILSANNPSMTGYQTGAGLTVTMHSTGEAASGYSNLNKIWFLSEYDIRNDLTTGDDVGNAVLSAYQGKVLNDKINGLLSLANSAPTSSTVGTMGQLVVANGALYICTSVNPQGTIPETYTYTWEKAQTALI